MTEVQQFHRVLGVVGGWVFALEHDPIAPMDRHLLRRLLSLNATAIMAFERGVRSARVVGMPGLSTNPSPLGIFRG
jgi:hypothetical protein